MFIGNTIIARSRNYWKCFQPNRAVRRGIFSCWMRWSWNGVLWRS